MKRVLSGLICLWCLGCPLARGATNLITAVTPNSAYQGTSNLLVSFQLSSNPPLPPPTNVAINSIAIGAIAGTALPHPNQYSLGAWFTIPGTAATGAQDVVITYGGAMISLKTGGFTILSATNLVAGFNAAPRSGVLPLTAAFTDASTGSVTNRLWDFGDGTTSTDAAPLHVYYGVGTFTVTLSVWGPLGSNTVAWSNCITVSSPPVNGAYVAVDTGQTNCYNDTALIAAPAPGQPFYGQDGEVTGPQPAYTNNGDGTVTDLRSGLMWVQSRGSQQVAWATAVSNAATCRVGGYSDWRMPTIKELYSLVRFSGADGMGFTNSAGYIPFIDTNYFGFTYGGSSTNVGSRIIDAQDWSATPYVSTTMGGSVTIFGYNFTDGRLKGYPRYNPMDTSIDQSNYVRYVRGNASYGINNFIINGDGTISDKATLLMWSRDDSGAGMNWSNALAWVQSRNAAHYLGHNDWRLPNAKELHTLVDYTRSPDTTASAAISAVFNCTAITNEAGQRDFPWYWSGTTLQSSPNTAEGVYVCFGRAMGYNGSLWQDMHGAGAQRSDPKGGSLSSYTYVSNGYYSIQAPQGDAVRIFNYVRLVRDIPVTNTWRFAFVGDTHTPLSSIPAEIAAAVVGDDARFLIVAGDIVEAGAACSPATFATQLATWRSAMAAATASGVGVYALRGNHEADVPNGLPVWTNFFSGAYAMPTNGPAGETGLTYALTYSNALFLGFDEYVNSHRVNQAWLGRQLEANRVPHLFVFGHEPAFKAFHTDCLDNAVSERDAFWNSLAAFGARVYLCGHDHFLNVARIDDGDGNPSNDLYQFIVGTGGTTNWPVQRYNYNGANSAYTPVNVANVTNTYGYLLVEFSGPGTNDLGVNLTWKQRAYDTNTASFIYLATTNVLSYTALSRYGDSVGDGIPDWWRALYFGGSGGTTNSHSSATGDPDGDGVGNLQEYLADTDPTNAASRLVVTHVAEQGSTVQLDWVGGGNVTQTVECCAALASNIWISLFTNTPPTTVSNELIRAGPGSATTSLFYRIQTSR